MPSALEAADAHGSQAPGRGRGLQLLLLIMGVGLLTIAAAFFLTYAWFTFDLVWRAVSTVAVTLVAIVGASWLRRAQLRAAAEGVAALGTALIVLDTWAASALGLFGFDRLDQALYWGAALIVLAIVFEAWARLTALRFPAIAASIAIAPGVGLIAAGAAGLAGDGPTRFAIGAVGAALGALVHVAWRRRPRSQPADAAPKRRLLPFAAVLRHASTMDRAPEITIVAIVGLLSSAASLIALVLPLASPALDVLRPWALVVLAAATAGQAWLLPTHDRPRWIATLAPFFASLAVVSLLAAPVALGAAGIIGQVWAAVAALLALALPAALDLLRARLAERVDAHTRRAILAALITALAGAGAVVVASLLANRAFVAAVLTRVAGADADSPFALALASPWTAERDGLAIGLVAGLVAAGAIAWRPARRRIAPYWSAAAVVGLTFAAWQARSPMLAQAALIGCLAAVVIALVLTIRHHRAAPGTPGRNPLRVVLWIGAGVVGLHLVAIGAVTVPHQLVSALAIVTALVTARFAVIPQTPAGRTANGRVALTAAAALTALAAAITAPRLWSIDSGIELPLGQRLAVIATGAAFTAAAVLLPRRVLPAAERVAIVALATYPAVLAGAAATITVASWPGGSADGPLPQPATALIATALLAAATAAGCILPLRALAARTPATTPRETAGAWMLPALAIAGWAPLAIGVVAIVAAISPEEASISVQPAAALVTLAAVALATAGVAFGVRRAGGRAATLWRLDAPALALVFLAIVALAGRSLWSYDGGTLALGLAIGAITVVLVAANADGLVGAPGHRKHLGWPAVPLACWAWLAFVGTWPGTPTVEARWLPVGLILVATGLAVWWFGRGLRGPRRAVTGPLLLAAGALAGGIPVAMAGATDTSPLRTIILGTVAAAALLALTAPRLPRAIAEIAAPLAGALAVILTAAATRRTTAVDPGAADEFHALVWLAPMLVLLALAATLATRSGLLHAARSWPPAPAIGLVIATSVAIGATLLTAPSLNPAGATVALACIALIGVAVPANALRPAVAAIAPFAASAALPLVFASAFASTSSPALLVTATLGLAVANAVATIRLRREHPALSAPAIALLPMALFAVFIGALQVDALATALRSFPSAAVGGFVALAAAMAVATVDFTRGERSAPGRRVSRFAVESGAIVTVMVGFTVAGAFDARYDTLNWALFGAVLIAAGATPRWAGGRERIARRVARLVGTPILAIAAGAATNDLWPAAHSSLAIAVAGASVLAVGIAVALLAYQAPMSAGGAIAADASPRPSERLRPSPEALIEIWAGGVIGLVVTVFVDASAPGSLVTHLVVAVVAALALTVWAAGVLPPRLAAYGSSVVAPAGLALALLPVVRSFVAANAGTTPISDLATEFWGLPVLITLVGAAWLATLRTTGAGAPADRVRAGLARGLTVAAAASVTLSNLIAIDDTQWWRPTVWVCVLAIVAVTAQAVDRAPFDRGALIASAAGVGVIALAALASGSARYVEQLTVPIGLAAVLFGAIALARWPRAGSWSVLAPGIVVLLLPSFVAQFADAPLWRIVGVGLAALVMLVWGLTARLQAPFLLGLGLTISQAITAFWIALDSANREVPWWIWLAVAGLVLLVLAIRFEASLRDARKSAATIRAMR